MKTIFNIAKTELQILFYSPIAWLILIIFTIQVAMNLTGQFEGLARNMAFGYDLDNVTLNMYTSMWNGVFPKIQDYLYLYIPLITMGLMSRELGSGSIKLLYSSPVTNTQIILGKYLSMMIYGLALMAIVAIFVIFSAFVIKDFDLPAVLSGMLGLYFLICAYAAVGLFMSSLTSYQVVAAICTLVMLGVLTYVKSVWQDIAFVRDITYWLSMSGRADELIGGLICSEDVLYFIIVITLFLTLGTIRLQACRQKSPWMVTWGKYIGVFCIAMFLGYLSSRPKLMTFYDATATKVRTLTPNSQEVIKQLKGGLTMTTYVNLFDSDVWYGVPAAVNRDMNRFRQYRRFKPEIRMNYVYYYDTMPGFKYREGITTLKEQAEWNCKTSNFKLKWFLTPEQIRQKIDLYPEQKRFVRLLERESGEKTFLRLYSDQQHHPGEAEITAAMKRMAMTLPRIGFLHGHGERDNRGTENRNYNQFAQDKYFRYSLINQGFDIEDVTLDTDVPLEVTALVIADVKESFSSEEMERLNRFIDRGGNLVIMGEPKRQEYMNPLIERFGVKFLPGTLVKRDENLLANFMLGSATPQAKDIAYQFGSISRWGYWPVVTMPGCVGLEYTTDKGFTVTPLIKSDSLCWNELETVNFLDDTVVYNPAAGEVQKCYPLALALERQVGDKSQKILIFGDADWCGNGEIGTTRPKIMAENYSLLTGSFYWLSDGEVPIDVRRPKPTDDSICLSQEAASMWTIILKWILPILMGIIAIVVWIRRRGR